MRLSATDGVTANAITTTRTQANISTFNKINAVILYN